MHVSRLLLSFALGFSCIGLVDAQQDFIFFGRDRERITEKPFLSNPNIAGAQIKYMWWQLEPTKGVYDFSAIRHDLKILQSKGKKLFVQLQDSSFYLKEKVVPPYLLHADYDGGVCPQFDNDGKVQEGWVAKRWNRAVQVRFHLLLAKLGKEFDGKIEGINLPETSIGVEQKGKPLPNGYSHERYFEAVLENMAALKKAFPNSTAMQYANFMPGEDLPADDKKFLSRVYSFGNKIGVAMGGPDLLPFRYYQQVNSYALLQRHDGVTGIAVQDGNYADIDRKTGKRMTAKELRNYARETLKVKYIFWCTEEPYYSKEVLPMLRAKGARED